MGNTQRRCPALILTSVEMAWVKSGLAFAFCALALTCMVMYMTQEDNFGVVKEHGGSEAPVDASMVQSQGKKKINAWRQFYAAKKLLPKIKKASPATFKKVTSACRSLKAHAYTQCGKFYCVKRAACSNPCKDRYGQPVRQVIPLIGNKFYKVQRVSVKEKRAKERNQKELAQKQAAILKIREHAKHLIKKEADEEESRTKADVVSRTAEKVRKGKLVIAQRRAKMAKAKKEKGYHNAVVIKCTKRSQAKYLGCVQQRLKEQKAKAKAKHGAKKLEKNKEKGDHKVDEAIHRMNSKLNSRIKAATHVRSKKHTRKLHQLIADAKHGMQQRLKQEKRKRQELGTKEKQVKAHRADDISKARVKGDARLAKAQKQITKQEVKAEDRYFERKLHSQFSKIVREAFAKKDLPPKKAVAPLSAAKVGPFKEAAQRRVAKRAKHLRSKVLKLSAKLAKLRQESTLRKAKLRLKASKARAQQRLLRLKDAREDELEIARFPKHVRKKLRSMHAALMHSKTKAFQRKKLAQLKQEEKHAFANVLRNQRSVSRMTTRLAAAKAHLAKLC